MKKIPLIILCILFAILLIASYMFVGWKGVHASFASVVIYTLIVSGIWTLMYMFLRWFFGLLLPSLRGNLIDRSMIFFRRCLYFFGYLIILLPLVSGYVIYGLNNWWAGEVSRYVIEGPDKTIVFQSMSHLASPEFYDDVVKDLEKKGEEGYVLFFEGVRPGTIENEQAFAEALGFSVDDQFYDTFQKLTGLQYQGERDFYGLAKQDINVDLSIDEIMEIYRSNPQLSGKQQATQPIGDMFVQLQQDFDKVDPEDRKIIQYGYRAVFSFLLNMAARGDISLPQEEVPLFSVILHDRNAHIAQTVYESDHDKIYLMYGALHFDGILEELKILEGSKLEKWRVVSEEKLRVIR